MSDLPLNKRYKASYTVNSINIQDTIYNCLNNDIDEIKKEIAALTGAAISDIDIISIQEQ